MALTEDGHHEQVYTLSGPRGLTFGEAVAAIAKASGRSITYETVTPEQYREELLAEGASQEAAEELNALYAKMRGPVRRAARRGAAGARPRSDRLRRLRRPYGVRLALTGAFSGGGSGGRWTRTSLAGSAGKKKAGWIRPVRSGPSDQARQIRPRASMASATRRKPSMFAPAT
ncbi:hypothetical protein GCM10027203_75480 [Nonomuraea fastidiosa]